LIISSPSNKWITYSGWICTSIASTSPSNLFLYSFSFLYYSNDWLLISICFCCISNFLMQFLAIFSTLLLRLLSLIYWVFLMSFSSASNAFIFYFVTRSLFEATYLHLLSLSIEYEAISCDGRIASIFCLSMTY